MDYNNNIPINKKRFKTPKGYFESISYENISENKIKFKGFIVPRDYFTSIDKQQIFNRIYINKIKYIRTNFYKVASIAAIFVCLFYILNYSEIDSHDINSNDVINYVNEDFIILTNSDYTEFLDSDDLNYTNLITYGDIESYFLESTNIDLENLMIE
ncbi:MAG: hypothetical protein CMC38_04160 [Flavobacteriaceae bacterium]|nr:hypothetical protein [Flavobacteriaceae bacterium]|tara:strand:- start:2965 stop:3435 length:471 start_codon:yes stop_codon:yes gene_type:complete